MDTSIMKRLLSIIIAMICIVANAQDYTPDYEPIPGEYPGLDPVQHCNDVNANSPNPEWRGHVSLQIVINTTTKRRVTWCGWATQSTGYYWFEAPGCSRYSNTTLVVSGNTLVCRGSIRCDTSAGSVIQSGYYPSGPVSTAMNPSTGRVLTWKEQDGRHTPRSFSPGQANNACVNSCTSRFRISMNGANVIFKTPVINGVRQVFVMGEYVSTGEGCTPTNGTGEGDTPAPPGQVDPNTADSCDPVKQDKITLNGKDICVNKSTGNETNPTTGEESDGSTKTDKDIKKENTPNGGTKTTETERTKNPDGSVTEKKTEVTCDSAGNCKTSVTSSTTGRGDSQSNPDKEQDDMCKKNPKLKLCEEKSKYTDSGCDTPPACDGDAIQCGIAAEVKRRNCKDEKDLRDAKQQLENSSEVARYNADKAANSDAPGAAWGSGTGPGGSDSINFADKFNPDAFQPVGCSLRDLHFTLDASPAGGGHTYTIEVSRLCDYMPLIQAATLIAAGIASLFVLYNGITRSA